MAASVTGASLSEIYNRLKNTESTYPMDAKTFSDWSIEAGDKLSVTRDGKTYGSAAHTTTMTWKGTTPTVEVNSTGNEKRESVSKIKKKKYNSGGAGVRNDEKMYTYEVNQDHLLYEVYDTNGRFSKLEVTVRGLYHEVYDSSGRFSKLQNTVHGLYHEVYDSTGRFSKLQNTVYGLYHEVYDSTGKFSRLQNTVNGLYHEVYDTNGKYSKLQNTVNGLYHEVYDPGGAVSTLQNTANGFETRISKVVDANGTIKSASIATAINGSSSEVYIEADHIKLSGNILLQNAIGSDNGGNIWATGNIQAGLSGGNYIRGKTLHLIGGSSSQSADEQVLSSEDIKDMIIKLSVSGNTLSIWKHGDAKTGNPSMTFSKATTLSGDWSSGSGIFKVTASPQGNTKKTQLFDLTNGDISWNGNVATCSVYANIDDGETKYDTGKRLTVNATGRYNAGRAAVTLGEPTWNAITGQLPSYRTVTVSTVGRTDASGGTANLSQPIALYLTKSNLTVSMRTGSESGTTYASITCSDSNLKKSNIKSGVEIFGVTGEYTGESYTKYTFARTRTQDASGYHYKFEISTGWQTPFGGDGGTYSLYKKD